MENKINLYCEKIKEIEDLKDKVINSNISEHDKQEFAKKCDAIIQEKTMKLENYLK